MIVTSSYALFQRVLVAQPAQQLDVSDTQLPPGTIYEVCFLLSVFIYALSVGLTFCRF